MEPSDGDRQPWHRTHLTLIVVCGFVASLGLAVLALYLTTR